MPHLPEEQVWTVPGVVPEPEVMHFVWPSLHTPPDSIVTDPDHDAVPPGGSFALTETGYVPGATQVNALLLEDVTIDTVDLAPSCICSNWYVNCRRSPSGSDAWTEMVVGWPAILPLKLTLLIDGTLFG